MAASSTTRRGSGIPAGGAGHGGPKRGGVSNSKAGKPGPGCLGVTAGNGKAVRTREALEEAVPLAIATVIAIAGDRADLRSLNAAFGILNRVGLHEKSGVEHTGEGGGPMVIRRIIVPAKGSGA